MKKVQPTKSKPIASGSSVKSRIVSLMDLPPTGIKCLLYGKSKTGKTTLAASSKKKTLILSFETGKAGGSKSLAREKHLSFLQVLSTAELREIIDDGTVEGYESCIVDTVSQLESLILAEILGLDKLPEQKSWGLATREQYSECGLKTKTFLRCLLDMANDTWFLGQERASEPREDSELILPSVGVDLQPKTAGWLNAACDMIGHTFIRKQSIKTKRIVGNKEVITESATGKMEYCLLIGPDPVYVSGFRKPKGIEIPDVLINPTYADLTKHMGT